MRTASGTCGYTVWQKADRKCIKLILFWFPLNSILKMLNRASFVSFHCFYHFTSTQYILGWRTRTWGVCYWIGISCCKKTLVEKHWPIFSLEIWNSSLYETTSFWVGSCWWCEKKKRWGHSRCGKEHSRRHADLTPVGPVLEKEAVQQDGHVTISWYYSGHPSVRVEARAGSSLNGMSNGWMIR